jgi:hypothetical protein
LGIHHESKASIGVHMGNLSKVLLNLEKIALPRSE